MLHTKIPSRNHLPLFQFPHLTLPAATTSRAFFNSSSSSSISRPAFCSSSFTPSSWNRKVRYSFTKNSSESASISKSVSKSSLDPSYLHDSSQLIIYAADATTIITLAAFASSTSVHTAFLLPLLRLPVFVTDFFANLNSLLEYFFPDLITRVEKFFISSAELINRIPAPVVAIVTAALTVYFNQRMAVTQAETEARLDVMTKEQVTEYERMVALRTQFQMVLEPFIATLALLQHSLFTLGIGDPKGKWKMNAEDEQLFIAYVIAAYLGWVNIIKSKSRALNFGRRFSDRLIYNLVGRVQAVFSGSDEILQDFVIAYRYYSSDNVPQHAGPLYLSNARQSDIGQMMRKNHWSGVMFRSGRTISQPANANDSIISFADFTEILDFNPSFKRALDPLLEDIKSLSSQDSQFIWDHSRDSSKPWLRLVALQTSILDLIDYLDPKPYRFLPASRRKHLHFHNRKQDRYHYLDDKPNIVEDLFAEMATLRDGVIEVKQDNNLIDMLKTKVVTVFAVGCFPKDSLETSSEDPEVGIGACCDSHRILMALEQAGISHDVVKVRQDAKPRWLYTLEPSGKLPIISQNDMIMEELETIVDYIEAQDEKLKVKGYQTSVYDDEFSDMMKWRSSFLLWLTAEDEKDDKRENSMINDLQDLDEFLKNFVSLTLNASSQNFIGGDRLCSLDCALIPSLYQLDIVSRYVKKFTIPAKHKHLNRYISNFKDNKVFLKTKPRDEILIEDLDQTKKRGIIFERKVCLSEPLNV